MTACNECTYGKQRMEEQYICSHPVYPRKKMINRETFHVLKKLGCGSAVELI